MRDPVAAIDFDLAAAARLLDMERAAVERLTPGSEEGPAERPAREVRW